MPSITDIASQACQVRKVPTCDIRKVTENRDRDGILGAVHPAVTLESPNLRGPDRTYSLAQSDELAR
jgi:hypothetical protein